LENNNGKNPIYFSLCFCSLSLANPTLLSKIKTYQNAKLSTGAYSLVFYGEDYVVADNLKYLVMIQDYINFMEANIIRIFP
jgi:hypothetical protein